LPSARPSPAAGRDASRQIRQHFETIAFISTQTVCSNGEIAQFHCRASTVVHRIAHSLFRGLSALALSGCIVLAGGVAVDWNLGLALERSADRATRSAVQQLTPLPLGKSVSGF
jgi:hypothetical protein